MQWNISGTPWNGRNKNVLVSDSIYRFVRSRLPVAFFLPDDMSQIWLLSPHVNFRCFSVGEYGLIICREVKMHRRILICGEKVPAVSELRAQSHSSLFYLTTPGLLRFASHNELMLIIFCFIALYFLAGINIPSTSPAIYPVIYEKVLVQDWIYTTVICCECCQFFTQNIASSLFSEFYYFLHSRFPVFFREQRVTNKMWNVYIEGTEIWTWMCRS